MKAQLWKELRRNSHLIIAAGIVLAMPYAIAVIVGLLHKPPYDYPSPAFPWPEAVTVAGVWSLGLSLVLAPFAAGNAMAGERADRSAEFQAYLPIPRGRAIRSKAIVALGIIAAVWIAIFGIQLLLGSDSAPLKPDDHVAWVVGIACTTALMFGAAWLFSSFLRTPGNAAGAGFLAALMLGGTLVFHAYVTDARWSNQEGTSPVFLYEVLCCPLGIACFIAGTKYYLRRVEP